MGLKPSQGELNAALQPLFAHMSTVHLIHDDIVIATITEKEHIAAVEEVMQILSNAGVTANPTKCVIGEREIRFWGMIVSEKGIRPDPEKVGLGKLGYSIKQRGVSQLSLYDAEQFGLHTRIFQEGSLSEGND